MKKNIKRAIKTIILTFVSISLYSFPSILSTSLVSTNNRVLANSLMNSDTYNNSKIFAKSDASVLSTLSDQQTTVQVDQQIPVYGSPSASETLTGFVSDQQVKILNKEGSYYYIEYNSTNGICRGYIKQKYLSSDLQVSEVDYSRSKQSVWINKSTTMYTGPSDSYVSTCTITQSEITLLAKEDTWCFVEYSYLDKTKRGYVTSDSITVDSSPNTLPEDSPSLDEKIKALFNTIRPEIGFTGSGEKSNITKYGLWYGIDDTPWSAIFISWAANHSNLQDVIPKTASYSDSLKWFKSRNLFGNTAKVGAIVFFKNQTTNYVGIVESINNDDTITVLVGGYQVNDKKQVARVTIKNNSIAGYGYPQYSLSGLGYSEEVGHAVIYNGPSDQYSQIGSIENSMVKILNKENNYFYIEYSISGIKGRGYIDSSYIPTASEATTANYDNTKKVEQVISLTTVYNGPATCYSTNGFIENQQVTILNKEDNWCFIEYTNENIIKRGYVIADYVKEIPPPKVDTPASTGSADNSNSGTTDVGEYVYKFTNAITTSYNHKGCGAAGENYYCDGSGQIVAAHNMRAGTVIYIPDLKYINSTGIFTVGDTGGPFFDFDINTNKNIDKGPHDVYVLSWGDGPMMQSFESAKNEQVRYGQWNRLKGMYENYTFQTENFTQP